MHAASDGSHKKRLDEAVTTPRTSDNGALIFLRGFTTPASSYRDLLAETNMQTVAVPHLYRVGPRVLSGQYSVVDEATDAANFVETVTTEPVWLAGHSRGGHAALLAALSLSQRGLPVAGLILVDPVSTGPMFPHRVPSSPATVSAHPPLVIGAGLGGRCAPKKRNHSSFANALPGALHVVIPHMGHADVLVGKPRAIGRKLCGGGPDPDAMRNLVGRLLRDYIACEIRTSDSLPRGVTWGRP